jgi:hypothetical protein
MSHTDVTDGTEITVLKQSLVFLMNCLQEERQKWMSRYKIPSLGIHLSALAKSNCFFTVHLNEVCIIRRQINSQPLFLEVTKKFWLVANFPFSFWNYGSLPLSLVA